MTTSTLRLVWSSSWDEETQDTILVLIDECESLKSMDRIYRTDKRSPLHHDNRCPHHLGAS